MKGFLGIIKKVCFINDTCDDAMILWDMSTPWDGPTEWR